jgi:hypothetical protein
MSCVHQTHLTHLLSTIFTYAFYSFSPSHSFSIYFLMILPFFMIDQKCLCGEPWTFASKFDLFKSFQIIPLLLLIYIWDPSSKFHSDVLTIFLSFCFGKIQNSPNHSKILSKLTCAWNLDPHPCNAPSNTLSSLPFFSISFFSLFLLSFQTHEVDGPFFLKNLGISRCPSSGPTPPRPILGPSLLT